MLPEQFYSIDRDLSELPLEGDGGLRHLRLVLNTHWMMHLRADNEATCSQIRGLLDQVAAEIRSRKVALKA